MIKLRRAVRLILAVLVLSPAACVPPVPSNDEIVEFTETTAMGLIQARGVMRVGIEADGFPLGADGDRPIGFAAAIGTEIAESLGVEPLLVPAPRAELVRAIDAGALDIAFPLSPITEEAVARHAFSDPWWVGHQRVLLLEGIGRGGDAVDLRGVAVCDAPEDVTGIPIRDLVSDVGRIVRAADARECLDPLIAGRAQAASGPDVLLLALLPELFDLRPRIAGAQQATAGYGVMMARDAIGLNGFVDLVLREIDSEGRWEEWYEEYVTPVTGEPSPGIPLMTLEEAAALHPK